MQRTKKVLHIFVSIEFSGAELMYAAASKIFIDNGFQLYALSTGKEVGEFADNLQTAGYTIKHLPFIPFRLKACWNFIQSFFNFYRYLKTEKIDILHIHRENMFSLYALMGKVAGVPVVLRTVHSNFTPSTYRWPIYLVSRLFAKLMIGVKFTSISDSVYNNERKCFRNITSKIYNWYNSDVFIPASLSEKKEIRHNMGIEDQQYVLISVGSCQSLKRHCDIILALKQLLKLNENYLYLHLGDGELNAEEQALVNKLDLQNNVRFLGNQSMVRDYLVASDVYIMPSDFEGLSISAIEAMACEIPCVFYNSPGLRELMPGLQFKKYLIEKDYKNIVSTVLGLKTNTASKEELIKLAKDNVTRHYEMRKNVNTLISLYNGQ